MFISNHYYALESIITQNYLENEANYQQTETKFTEGKNTCRDSLSDESLELFVVHFCRKFILRIKSLPKCYKYCIERLLRVTIIDKNLKVG